MALTSIGQQKTPSRPIELTFAAETGLPSDNQELLLVGHVGDSVTGINTVININNVADIAAASGEAMDKFGDGELTMMIVAAVRANTGSSTFPAIKVVALEENETSFPLAAQTAIQAVKAEFLVSPYDMQNDSINRNILRDMAIEMSGAQRTNNNQFGTLGVAANMDQVDPSLLFAPDTLALVPIWFRDTSVGDDQNPYSIAEVAAAAAARMASNGIPFNPVDSLTIPGIPTPVKNSDWITVGGGLESEACLNQGWTPLFVKPNGEVSFVRSVTSRLSVDGTGSPLVNAYYDVQDFQVLYFWRKTLYTRFSQPDFTRTKASSDIAQLMLSEMIRLALQFQDQQMFQAVEQLSKFFKVERNVSDRHRFDFFTPVNVIPGLHVIAGNIQATTEFDVVTI